MNKADLAKLADFFPPEDLEWRIGQANAGSGGEIKSATVLAYLTNRAIMDRLDAVVGPARWKNEYKTFPSAKEEGMMCGISIRMDDGEWVTKWDAAPLTTVEPVKGAMSDSMKRAAVHWGIGRYLYDLPKTWAAISDNGEHYSKAGGKAFKWDAPTLPSEFLPPGYKSPPPKQDAPPRKSRLPAGVTGPEPDGPPPAEADEKALCPKCGGAMWDNRQKKTNPKAPDWKCKDKTCDGVWWPGKWPPTTPEPGGSGEPADYTWGDEDLPF